MITNYLTLRNTIADWLNRTDLNDIIPTFVALGESDIRTDLRSRAVVFVDTLLLSGPEAALPEDVKLVRSLYDEFGPIKLVAPEVVAEMRAAYPSGARRASVAAVLGQDDSIDDLAILLPGPITQEDMEISIVYEPDIPALVDDDQTTWLLRKHPNIYLYAALKHSAAYLRDDERIPLWDKLYSDSIRKLERLRDDLEFGAGPLVAMPRTAL